MTRLVLGTGRVTRRMKAVRLALIHRPGRVITQGRRLILRVCAAGPTLALLLSARQTRRRLAHGPSG